MTSPRELVSAYWAAAEARDWEAFGRLLAEDVVYEAPMSHERVSGKAAYLRFNAEGFTTDWHLTVKRVVADEGSAASWIEMNDAGETYPGLTLLRHCRRPDRQDHRLLAGGVRALGRASAPDGTNLTRAGGRTGQVGEPAAAPVCWLASQRLRVRSQSSGTV